MNLPATDTVKTEDEARQLAIDWQRRSSEESMYMSELIEYTEYFAVLGNKFGLTEEFKENGIL